MIDSAAPIVKTGNIGDSGYIKLRKEGLDLILKHQSNPQWHNFNFPFQVGTSGDDPSCADFEEHIVKDKDIFLVATDGLWDNLYLPSILDILRPFIRKSDDLLDPELIVEILGKEAEKFSNMVSYRSPFAKQASRYFSDYDGGKIDDITIILAQVNLNK